MTVRAVVVRGEVKPDGRLEFQGAPPLPVGPVEITVRPLSVAGTDGEDWWQYAVRVRHELEATGHPFMNDEEMKAHLDWLRESDLIDSMLRSTKTPGPDHGHL